MTLTTSITAVGNLTRDPELRSVSGSREVVSFTVAVASRVRNKETNKWEDGEPTFLRCTAWDEMASNIAASLTKGSRVIVHGSLKQSKYTDNKGVERVVLDLQVDEVGVTLKFHVLGRAEKRTKMLPPQSGWVSEKSSSQDNDGWVTVDDDDTPF
jgi:single-strand DNA-binding protein